jgi:phosphopantothenoylcysteine decarboxylase
MESGTMANVLLGVTGSVAAIRTPSLYAQLKQAGHQVRVVATQASLYFFDPLALDPTRRERNPEIVTLDEDEWPGRTNGRRWQRDDPVLHIELRRWADLFVIAPLDANTLAKLAYGLSDNCLTCIWRAWDPERPQVLAPAMNTLMWEQRVTAQHLRLLAANAGQEVLVDAAPDAESALACINRGCSKVRIVAPVSKRLACGDLGVGAMAGVEEIVAAVQAMLA